jgi:hypothetical protein
MQTDGPRENATERRIHQSGFEPEYQKGTTCRWTEVRSRHAQHLSYVAAEVSKYLDNVRKTYLDTVRFIQDESVEVN